MEHEFTIDIVPELKNNFMRQIADIVIQDKIELHVLESLATQVLDKIDEDSAAKAIVDRIDMPTLLENIDVDAVVEEVVDRIDVSDLTYSVVQELDYSELAYELIGRLDYEEIVQNLDLTDIIDDINDRCDTLIDELKETIGDLEHIIQYQSDEITVMTSNVDKLMKHQRSGIFNRIFGSF